MANETAGYDASPITFPTARRQPLDPPDQLTSMRDKKPIWRMTYPDGHTGWLVCDYELAKRVLADSRFSMAPQRSPVLMPETRDLGLPDDARDELTGQLAFTDPPEHTKRRRILAGKFTARRVAEHRSTIEKIVRDQLDEMEKSGAPVDFVKFFALPVPSKTLCKLLGVPEEERHEFEEPMRLLSDQELGLAEKNEALRRFVEYSIRKIQEKKNRPDDDLLSLLASTKELSDIELAGIAMQLFAAGHDTTASMLALGTYTLLVQRSQWEHLVADESMIKNAVEELLRYLTIFQLGTFTRTATEDFELGDVQIRAGDSVSVALSTANRDPKTFKQPDILNVNQARAGHLAFGHGIHMCLGQHLARLEMNICFEMLTARFPRLRLADPENTIRLHGNRMFLHGVHELPLTWID